MKRILLTALCLGLLTGGYILEPLLIPAQLGTNTSIPSVGNLPDHGPTLPASCNIGQIYFLIATTATNNVGLYMAISGSPCTWVAAGTGDVLNPSTVNNTYYVSGNNGADGNSNTTLQSIYNSSSFKGGTIYLNLAPGTTLSYPADMFQNTAAIPSPTVAFIQTANCGGLSGLTPGQNLSVFIGEYDSYGNWDSSAVVQNTVPAGASCYTVTWSNTLYAGQNSSFTGSGAYYATFALQCASACALGTTKPAIAGTLQFSSGASAGAVAAFGTTAPTTPSTFFYGYTTAASVVTLNGAGGKQDCTVLTGSTTCPTGMVFPSADAGLLIGNTTIHVNTNGGIFQHFPTTIPWGSRLVMDNPVNGGYSQLSSSAPNAIPVLSNVYGAIVTDGAGTNTVGNQISELNCLFTQPWFGQTAQLINCSSPVTSPQFTATTQDWKLLAPAPPYVYQARVASTFYWVGEAVSDQHTPECIWLATTAGTTASTATAFPTCGTEGSQTSTDGTATFLLIRKGRSPGPFNNTIAYTQGTILTNGGIDYEVITVGGGNVSTTPAFNTNFGGCDTSTASCAVALADGYQYQAISTVAQGPNLLVAPQYQSFGISCVGQVQLCSTPNSTWKALAAANQFNWSGCSGTTGVPPLSNSGTCPTSSASTNAAVLLSYSNNTPANPGLPITVGGANYIADGGACPAGNGTCNTITNVAYFANYTMGTPAGIIPLAIGEATATPTAGHSLVITGPPLPGASCTNPGCPAMNAVGWYAGLATATGAETPQIPDGVNAICGNGSPSAYVGNLPHHALCNFGQTETIFQMQTVKPFFPMFNASETIFNIGGITPLGSQNGNPLTGVAIQGYGSRIEDWEEECGRTANVGEPYAWFAFSSNGQEQSGPYRDKPRDCMSGYFYGNGPGNQNTSVYIGHVLGQLSDYTAGTLIQDVPAFRLFQDHSASAFAQGSPYVSQFGIGIFTSPQWNSAGPIGGQINSVEFEIAFDGVQLRDAKGVSIANLAGSAVRPMNNLVHADYLTRDLTVMGSQNGGGGCALFYEVFNVVSGTCTTGADKGIGLFSAGDVADVASASEAVFTTSAAATHQASLAYSMQLQGAITGNNVANIAWSGVAAANGAADTNVSRVKPGVVGLGTGAQASIAALELDGNGKGITSDYTNATVTPTTLTSWTLPNLAQQWKYDCKFAYRSSAVTATLGVYVTNSAASITQQAATAIVDTTLGGVGTTATIVNNTGVTAQNVIIGAAPGIIATDYFAEIYGSVEVAAVSTDTFSIQLASCAVGGCGAATGTITVKRDTLQCVIK